MRARRTRSSHLGALALTALTSLLAQGAAAQQQSSPGAGSPSPSAATDIDPKALAVLKAGCAALGAARSLSFTVTDTYEHAARNGQPLYYTVKSEVTLQRPDKLKVVKVGDGVPDEFYYDGKTVMAYVPSENVVAVADASPTIDAMLESAWDYAEVHFPFADALVSNPCDIFDGMKSAFYVGQSQVVGGVTTDMVAIALSDAQGEMWIGAADHLPRMVRTVYRSEPAQARYQTEYSNWRCDAPVDPAVFTSPKAAAAKRIAFQPPSATAAANGAPARPAVRPVMRADSSGGAPR